MSSFRRPAQPGQSRRGQSAWRGAGQSTWAPRPRPETESRRATGIGSIRAALDTELVVTGSLAGARLGSRADSWPWRQLQDIAQKAAYELRALGHAPWSELGLLSQNAQGGRHLGFSCSSPT